MSKRVEIMNAVYTQTNEDTRLNRSRHGQLERLTTMAYIHRYAPKGATLLEIGAGTGRYAIPLAREGYDVTALELVPHNLDVLQTNSRGVSNLQALQGDALNLRRFPDATFDTTLLLGPMYHLYTPEDVHRALDEALRVTKPGGVLIAAFLSVHAIMFCNYLNDRLGEGLTENFTEDWRVRHFEEQVFTGYDVAEFEALFIGKPATHLTTAAADSVLELAEVRSDFTLSEEDFARFAAYHLATCETRELLGASSHLLYICRKG